MSVIIHHASCFDGVAGAWAVLKYLGDPSKAQIIPCSYDEREKFNISKLDQEDVYIVDFSFPHAQLVEMAKVANKIVLIDHHKTAQEDLDGKELPGNVIVHFDMNRSGAGLAWDVLFPKIMRPWFIDNIEDRDLWRFKLPNTKAIIAFLAATKLDVWTFEQLIHWSAGAIADRGSSILQYIDTFGEKLMSTWTINPIGGHLVPTINTPYMNCSDHIDKLMNHIPGHKFYAAYFCKAGNVWQFSLRSSGDFDVSEVAKLYGGGGHKNAAGFTVRTLPWMHGEN
jgi:oligoribonuclease NrnB/cAMP/cGMP phosphodiesterase (DHH superfamily)